MVCWHVHNTGGKCTQMCACRHVFNCHTVFQLSADVLRRMRESEKSNSPSSLPDNQNDPPSKLQSETLPVFQRSIRGSCHEKIQMPFSILSKKTKQNKFTNSVDIYTSFLRCEALIERNTGRNPQKVSGHILPYISPFCSLFLPVLLSQDLTSCHAV